MLKQLATGIMLTTLSCATFADSPQLSWKRQNELIRLVRQDCGSCHGLQLTGGLGPALTPEALKHRPAESLIGTLLHGRPGTAMPPWKELLSEADAAWIVHALERGFPDAR